MMSNTKTKKPRSLGRRILFGVAIVVGGAIVCSLILIYVFFLNYTVPTGAMEGTVMTGDRILARRVSFENGNVPSRGTIIAFSYPGDRDDVEPMVEQVYMKRCVAVAGDTLEVRGGYVYINGVKENVPADAQFTQNRYYSPESDKLRTFPKRMDFTRNNWGPMRIPKKGDVIPIRIENVSAWRIFIEREGHTVREDGQLVIIDNSTAESYTVERDYVFGMGDNRNDSQDSRYWGFIPAENIVGVPFLVYFSQHPESGEMRWDRIWTDIR